MKGIIRYYTDEEYLDFTKIGSVPATNGYVEIETNDNPILLANMNKNAVTKVEIVRYGDRKNIRFLAAHCEELKEFKVSATDESHIENMYAAFCGCTNLEIFDETLDFQKCQDFTHLFYCCDKLVLSDEFRERLNKVEEKDFEYKGGYSETTPRYMFEGLKADVVTDISNMFKSINTYEVDKDSEIAKMTNSRIILKDSK